VNPLSDGQQRFAELMPAGVAQIMTQCLCFCWHDALHKGKQNCTNILNARQTLQRKKIIKGIYYGQPYHLSLDQRLRAKRATNFLH